MKNTNKIKELIPYIINTLIILTIFFIVLKLNSFYPLGNINLDKYDAFYQYKPMLYNFITSIKNGTILSFNFLNGLGNPTIFNYLYYLASPINLIALFFKTPEAMFTAVIIIKIILTSLFATFYFKKKTNNNFISTICSIAYTFSGWFTVYYFHIMWLDSFMIFPLLQYGLEKLIKENKCYIYIFSLAYIMLTNFYMAFMICIYILIYYLYNLIIKKDKYINKIKNFQLIMFSTIITCLLCTFTIYATYSSFLKMGIYISGIEEKIAPLKVLDYLRAFFPGNVSVNINQFINNIPNICLNTIFIISFLYYFINSKINIKDKITTLIAIIFTTFVLFSNNMNFILNCFHIPAGYSFRYTFIISFYLLLIFIRNYKTFENKIDFKVYFINIILLIILIVELLTKTIEFNIFVFNLVFLLSYTIFLILYDNNKLHKYILLILIIMESITCFHIASQKEKHELIEYNYIQEENHSYRKKIDANKEFIDIINNNLYSNDSTLETFSSMQYNNTIFLLDDLGCATDIKATIYSCNNSKVFNMLFNVADEYKLPKLYAVNNNTFLYNIDTDNFITNQNNLIEGMTSIESIITENKLTPIKNYTYKITEEKEYIIPVNPNIKYIKINDILYTSNVNIPSEYESLNIKDTLLQNRLLIYNLKENDEIEITYYNEPEINELATYTVDESKLKQAHDFLKKGAINYTTYKDNLIEGAITVDENQVIFTSIPYDSSWHITLDDKEVKPIIIHDSLLGIECDKGTHKIKLEYKNNFNIATLISGITFISLIANIIINKIKK